MGDKLELNEAVVPKELIVGISGDLCYVTYMDGNKMNSEKSWTSWSSNAKTPLKIENKFSSGFKLGGVNSRWSRQASNADNLLISHPLFNKCFEISLDRFIEIARRTTIVNGVIDAELIMDKQRNILFRDEYDALVLAHEKKVKEQNKIKEKNLETKVKNSDQVPGKFYKDSKTNNEYVYLGTALVDDVLKHVYIEANAVKSIHKHTQVTLRKRLPNNNCTTETIDRLKYPSICYVSGRNFDDGYSHLKFNENDMYYYSDNSYHLRITISKISMSASNNTINIYDSYTEDDWKIVDRCFTRDFTGKVDRWGRRSSSDEVLKGTKAVNNFRKDYEEKIKEMKG